jgi:hypothetical protein
LLVTMAVMVVVGIVLAAMGPFGSFASGDFATRLGYWLPAVMVGFVCFRPVVALGDQAASGLALPRWAALTGAVLLAGIPATLAIAWLNGALGGGLPQADRLFPLYCNVTLVGALVTLLFLSLEKRRPAAADEAAPVGPAALVPQGGEVPVAVPFIERLPPSWAGTVRALEMEDHYVRAHGPGGESRLLLLRMSDAVRELSATDGLRVHRSWWVAREAVAGSRRDGRNLRLRLDDGREVPVARDRVSAVRAAGWLR